MNLFKGWQRKPVDIPMVSGTTCPGCACMHSVQVFEARIRGGNGIAVVSRPSGEVVRCCACGYVYTVLLDGTTLRPKERETPRNVLPMSQMRNRRELDEDIDDLRGV